MWHENFILAIGVKCIDNSPNSGVCIDFNYNQYHLYIPRVEKQVRGKKGKIQCVALAYQNFNMSRFYLFPLYSKIMLMSVFLV